MDENTSKVRVAIIGAGIGGLTLAVALKSLDKEGKLDVNIYEAAPFHSEIGAGINLWLRSWEVLKNIGLEQSLLNLLPEAPDTTSQLVFHMRKSDQKDGFPILDLRMKGGTLRYHRAELQRVLLAHAGGRIHLRRRLVSHSYRESGEEIQLEFHDGSTEICDILIGMDGINSTLRKSFLKDVVDKRVESTVPSDPIWSGTLAYRGLLSHDGIEKEFPGHRATTMPVMYCGKNKHIVVYPLSCGNLTNVVAFVTDPAKEGTEWTGGNAVSVPQEELLSNFVDWEGEVQALISCLKSPKRWAVHDIMPLEQYAHGRVFLAGDAAHAMTPHQGAGAGQAIEDAYMLAILLTHSYYNKKTIPELSDIYNTIRCRPANEVLLASRTQGKWCDLNAPGFEDVEEGDEIPREKICALFADVARAWDWVWSTSAEDDRKKLLGMLQFTS